MPNWKTHIKVANEINKRLNYKNIDQELYMLGNVLPDINNGYLIRNVSAIFSHRYTHFKYHTLKGEKSFFDIYQKEIKNNALFMGYYIHLLTDCIFDNLFYTDLKNKVDVKYSKEELRVIKQAEFEYFNNLTEIPIINFNNVDILLTESKKIKNVSLELEDIIKCQNTLNSHVTNNFNPQFYTYDEFEKLTKEAVKLILKQLNLEK